MKQNNESPFRMWSAFAWILGTVCMPLAIPWVVFNIVAAWKFKLFKNKLQGKVVLVTGASSGLGEALSHEFYKAGCRVILASRRQDELKRVRECLLKIHKTQHIHPPVIIQLDLSDTNSIPDFVNQALNIFGHVDILVNNAGVSYRGQIVTTGIDVDIKTMMVNYFGQVALTKALLPSMIKNHSGHIVAVSSVQAKIAIPYRSAYAASKHALQAFCDTLRAEVACHNVKVLVITAGYINTNLSLNAITGDGKTYGVLDETTAAGFSPEHVAREIVKNVVLESKEITVSQLVPRIAIYLRTFAPALYFWIMARRAKKQQM
ncbi:dehydrogenase/reductase SDR family protein 7-like [Bacillus rossius redtenbacheri]|uniref:dehydrogenase/reductase SDR family protein 7-like n=1 Tax=Bacillus rossius redtenbacheri TaxID=93214 RepID=UPI002FDEBE2B